MDANDSWRPSENRKVDGSTPSLATNRDSCPRVSFSNCYGKSHIRMSL